MDQQTKSALAQMAAQMIAEAAQAHNARETFEAHWRDNREFPNFQPGLIWLGRTDDRRARPVGLNPAAHCLTLASSRSGKGVSLLVPNALTWPGSLVCVDPKGENAQITARQRLAMGQKVAVLDPFGTADVPDECRATFNPLDAISPDDPAAESMARLIAGTLIDTDVSDQHFAPSAAALIAAFILLVCDSAPPEERNLDEVRKLICEDPDGQIQRLEEMTASARPAVHRMASALLATPEKERASFYSSARRGTDFLDDNPMRQVLGPSTFNLADLKTDPRGLSVFLCMPVDEIRTYSTWFRLMVRLALKAMMKPGRPATGHRTIFLLDEFHLLRQVAEIEDAAPLMAGTGVLLWPIVQQLGTLERDYPKSWPVFFGNASILTAFGVDGDEALLLSRRLGNYSDHAGGPNISQINAPLLTPQQIEQAFNAEGGYQLVMEKGQKPGILRRVSYYNDPAFPSWYPPNGFPGPAPQMVEPPQILEPQVPPEEEPAAKTININSTTSLIDLIWFWGKQKPEKPLTWFSVVKAVIAGLIILAFIQIFF